MQVQELSDLANWIKENVFDLHEMREDTDNSSLENTLDHRNLSDLATIETIDDVQSHKDEELSLLEFIIGIDKM